MTQHICLDTLRVGSDLLLPADSLDVAGLLARGDWSEALVAQLTKQLAIGEATRERFQVSVARRPAGSPWPPRGFTEAYLREAGLLDAETPEPPAPAPAAAGKPPKPQPAPAITRVELTEAKVAVGPYFLQPRKIGNFNSFDVCDAEGNLLRAKPFRDQVKATAFLEELYTSPAGPAPAQEGDDDRELQSGPVDGG